MRLGGTPDLNMLLLSLHISHELSLLGALALLGDAHPAFLPAVMD